MNCFMLDGDITFFTNILTSSCPFIETEIKSLYVFRLKSHMLSDKFPFFSILYKSLFLYFSRFIFSLFSTFFKTPTSLPHVLLLQSWILSSIPSVLYFAKSRFVFLRY